MQTTETKEQNLSSAGASSVRLCPFIIPYPEPSRSVNAVPIWKHTMPNPSQAKSNSSPMRKANVGTFSSGSIFHPAYHLFVRSRFPPVHTTLWAAVAAAVLPRWEVNLWVCRRILRLVILVFGFPWVSRRYDWSERKFILRLAEANRIHALSSLQHVSIPQPTRSNTQVCQSEVCIPLWYVRVKPGRRRWWRFMCGETSLWVISNRA